MSQRALEPEFAESDQPENRQCYYTEQHCGHRITGSAGSSVFYLAALLIVYTLYLDYKGAQNPIPIV